VKLLVRLTNSGVGTPQKAKMTRTGKSEVVPSQKSASGTLQLMSHKPVCG
jgi:hypothetical protein